MKVNTCGNKNNVSVDITLSNNCTFEIIDKWDPNQHAKTCDTMFYLSDGTGAYVWDCDRWKFLDFTGVTQSDWTAKQDEAGYIKNKPFKTLGNGLSVDEKGVLNIDAVVDIKDSDGEILQKKEGVVTLPKSSGSSVTSVNKKIGDVVLNGSEINVSPTDSRTIAKAIADGTDIITLNVRTNLDGLIKNHKWYTGSVGATNAPSADGQYFIIEVLATSSIAQRATSVIDNITYTRVYSGNPKVWSEWRKIDDVATNIFQDVPWTILPITEVAKSNWVDQGRDWYCRYRIKDDVLYIQGRLHTNQQIPVNTKDAYICTIPNIRLSGYSTMTARTTTGLDVHMDITNKGLITYQGAWKGGTATVLGISDLINLDSTIILADK